ncbi:MAG: large conductance mechanosensitive channel protein MscL [Clostridiales bacterium]|nr:large conductance mechanosensitive channel protein MscL [Clostridiales bacterium]MBR4947483.1 large conductance mechanosensitive channel protein MscL [Clostridiales bacterium]
MGLMKEFKEFALKGSVVDMAIGVIIGAAFKDIVTSFTDNFINPIISSIGGSDIAGSIMLPWVDYTGLTPEEAAALSLNYGAFISAIINFLIMALILFFMLKGINALKNGAGKFKKKGKKEEEPAPAPEPSEEVKLLTEIKDLLKAQNGK